MRYILIWVVTCIAIFVYSLSPCYALDVTLAWDANAETNLAGYKVYYGTTAGGPYNGSGSSEGASPIVVPLGSLTTPSSPEFTVHGLAGGTHYFVATAYNTDGLESGYSNEAYTQGSSTPPATPPTNNAPTLSGLEVNGTSGSATIYVNDSNRLVDIRIAASDDSLVSQYLILDGNNNANGGTFKGIPGGARQNPTFTLSDFVLNNSDGNHTVYAWVKDDRGLVSATATKTNVILDRAAPTVAISYSVSNPFNAGDVVTITANFTDSSPISGTPKISINYAGTGSDISNASMTQVSNKQWRYVITVPSGSDGTTIVTIAAADAAGNPVGSLTGSTFSVDNGSPTVDGFPVVNFTKGSITITYNESNMENATLASIYSLNNGLMLSCNTVEPDLMVPVDVDNDNQDELAVTFSGYGLWIYDPGKALANRWRQLTPVVPEAMIRQGNGIACDYGAAYGLWSWTQASGWQQLNTVDPGLMVTVGVDNDNQGELAVTFSGYGLWIYDPNTPANRWRQLNPIVPEAMIRQGNGIVCDYGAAYGLFTWTQAGGWQQINPGDPGLMVAVDIDNDQQEELVVTFPGYGVYTYDSTSGWQQINLGVPEAMIRMGNGIACDYGAVYGLWSWTQAGGWQQINPGDPGLMVAVDIDDDQQEELVADFPGYGLYSYDPVAGWVLLNRVAPPTP